MKSITNIFNKLAKARKTRKSPGSLRLKKFGLAKLWVEKVWAQNIFSDFLAELDDYMKINFQYFSTKRAHRASPVICLSPLSAGSECNLFARVTSKVNRWIQMSTAQSYIIFVAHATDNVCGATNSVEQFGSTVQLMLVVLSSIAPCDKQFCTT